MKQLTLEISPTPHPTLKNFIIGRNAELIYFITKLLESETTERFLYIWGDIGSGKSHLLNAITHQADELKQEAIFISCRNKKEPFEKLIAHNIFLTVLDDIDDLDENAQIKLFNLYNEIRENNGILIVSARTLPKHLKLREDLITRLSWGLVFHLYNLSDQEKAEALALHAQQRGFSLSNDVINYLLHHVKRDMPSLTSILDALDRYSLAEKRSITVPLLKEIFLERDKV